MSIERVNEVRLEARISGDIYTASSLGSSHESGSYFIVKVRNHSFMCWSHLQEHELIDRGLDLVNWFIFKGTLRDDQGDVHINLDSFVKVPIVEKQKL